MKMKSDFLLLQKMEPQEKSLIQLSQIEQAKADSDQRKKADVFIVKEAGEGRWENGKFIDINVKAGELILISKTFTFSPSNEKDKTYIFGMARDVIASY